MNEHNIDIVTMAHNFASDAHKRQTRRDNLTPYIKHPEDVANLLMLWGITDQNILATAYLHDVIEDTLITKEDIEEKFGEKISDMVSVLSHVPGEDYASYIVRISKSNCVLVKLADIICNLSDSPTEKQVKKYSQALKILIQVVSK